MLYWILIADAARARVYSTKGRLDKLHLVQTMDNPRGRAKGSDLYTDEFGRYGEQGKRGARSSMEPDTPGHVVEVEKFARKLADLLTKAVVTKECDSLALVAPATLLGLLWKDISPSAMKHVVASAARDFTTITDQELPTHLKPLLSPPLN